MVNYAATLDTTQLDQLVDDLSKSVLEGKVYYISSVCSTLSNRVRVVYPLP